MANAVLERFRAQRAEQIATMDAILEQVDDRDLVDAERGILEGCRTRIAELDAQIEPLEEYDNLRAQHVETVAALPQRPEPARPVAVGVREREFPYRTPGEFVVDYIRANGYMDTSRARDEDAASRLHAAYAYATRAVSNQTTANTPGILPTPIVGPVVSLIDANRPLIASLGGARSLGGIPGTTFTRPKVTQHTSVAVQSGEKTQLASQNMVISPISFAKATYGGTVDISRQDIDWTSPAAWDILIQDLANVYAIQTETAVATALAAVATTKVPVATNDLKGWTTALYTAAMHSYKSGFRMPDRVWCSLDVWAALGSLVDTTRVVLPPDMSGLTDAPMDSWDIGGSQGLSGFRGDILGVPRIVVPTFPVKTCIVGPSTLYEVYEEVIGLLSVIEPSILGVQVAYGGYLASGIMDAGSYVPLDASLLTLPTMADGSDVEPTDISAKAPEDTPGAVDSGETEVAESNAPKPRNGGK